MQGDNITLTYLMRHDLLSRDEEVNQDQRIRFPLVQLHALRTYLVLAQVPMAVKIEFSS